jgi:hypothetical protein
MVSDISARAPAGEFAIFKFETRVPKDYFAADMPELTGGGSAAYASVGLVAVVTKMSSVAML